MYIVENDNYNACWYIIQVIKKQTFYTHKVSRTNNVTKFIWSRRKTKALRFLTKKGITRFIDDYNLVNRGHIFVLREENGKGQGIIPVSVF